jgi:hypothetical protein
MKLSDIITEGRGVPQRPKPYGGSNPVAKNIEKFNRPVTHRDKKKELKKKGPEFNKHDYNSRDMDEGTYVAARADIIKNIVDKIRDKAFDDDDLVRQLASLINMKAQPRNGGEFRSQWQLDPIQEEEIEEQDCWDGYKKDGTQKGTGKNKGKRVNKCVPKE